MRLSKMFFLLVTGMSLMFSLGCNKCECDMTKASIAGTSWKSERIEENVKSMGVFTFSETEFAAKSEYWYTDPETGEEFHEVLFSYTGTYIYEKPSVIIMRENPDGYIFPQIAAIGNDMLIFSGGDIYHKQ